MEINDLHIEKYIKVANLSHLARPDIFSSLCIFDKRDYFRHIQCFDGTSFIILRSYRQHFPSLSAVHLHCSASPECTRKDHLCERSSQIFVSQGRSGKYCSGGKGTGSSQWLSNLLWVKGVSLSPLGRSPQHCDGCYGLHPWLYEAYSLWLHISQKYNENGWEVVFEWVSSDLRSW